MRYISVCILFVLLSVQCRGYQIAKLLSGTAIAGEIRKKLKEEVGELRRTHNGYQPGLAIVQVGNREDSNSYIRVKLKACDEIGLKCEHHRLARSVSLQEILDLLDRLNRNSYIHGIIVQLPLDCDSDIDSNLVTNSVSPEKDVEGLHAVNIGKLVTGDLSGFIPCAPKGILELISRNKINVSGCQAVVIGRSKVIGSPTSTLLKWHNATVTSCDITTRHIEKITAQADILVVAIGQPQFIRGSWIKPGATVIDCGINSIGGESGKLRTRLVGDVHYQEAQTVAGCITPVPGGVGPMTVAMLMKNTLVSAQTALKKSRALV